MKQIIINNLRQASNVALSAEADGERERAFSFYRLILEAIHALGSKYCKEADELLTTLLSLPRSKADEYFITALIYESRNQFQNALSSILSAIEINNDPHYTLCRIRLLMMTGDFETARQLIQHMTLLCGERFMQDLKFECAARELMPGDDYYALLAKTHKTLQPRNYLEIGLANGKSLALASGNTIALGVDPAAVRLDHLFFCSDAQPPKLYPLPSNDFFKKHDPRIETGHDSLDLVFIDGLHTFEQALMDFANSERYCSPKSTLIFHDSLPIDPLVAERNRCTGFWTGDVWKVVPCLKSVRPDLKIETIPCYPSGLVIVTNPDPTSTVLAKHIDQVAEHFVNMKLPDSMQELYEIMNCSGIAIN